MTTIVTKNGSGAPLASDLVQGELAVDLTNKRLYTEDSGGTVIEVGTNPSTIDINAGTIDGTVIGGASAAAGTFTTFTSTGIDDNATSTAITIDSSQRVGIGDTNPVLGKLVISDTSPFVVAKSTSTSGAGYVMFVNNGSNGVGVIATDDGGHMTFDTGSTGAGQAERMRIDSSGNVGIGTTSPQSSQKLHIADTSGNCEMTLQSSDSGVASLLFGDATDFSRGKVTYDNSSDSMAFQVNNLQEAMRIDSSGNVGIGTSSPNNPLEVVGSMRVSDNANPYIQLRDVGNSTNEIGVSGLNAGQDNIYISGYAGLALGVYDFRIAGFNGYITTRSNLVVGGALSKSSGSFRISHPLTSKTETHHLVHSFVEAPQADNIYRGKVDLVNGTATVNIDTVAGMTEGTFDALNREVQCFTSNESGWTAVRGSVSGNILTIEAQDNTCSDTISWMVVGERKDQHMYDTDWTDENGKVIVEPLKEE